MRAAVLFGMLLVASPIFAEAPPPIGTRIGDFKLPAAAGGPDWSLADKTRDAKAVVVLFLGTECPVNNAYAPTLAAMA